MPVQVPTDTGKRDSSLVWGGLEGPTHSCRKGETFHRYYHPDEDIHCVDPCSRRVIYVRCGAKMSPHSMGTSRLLERDHRVATFAFLADYTAGDARKLPPRF